jgi:hypothetical protein
MSDDLRNSTAPFSLPTQQAQPSASQAAPRKPSQKPHPVNKACPPADAPGSHKRDATRHHASKKNGDDDDKETIPRDLRPVPAERDLYSVTAFCIRHTISRDKFYELQSKGLAPDTIRIGNRQLITKEAAARWRKTLERAERDRKLKEG